MQTGNDKNNSAAKKKKNGPKLVENEECRRDLAKLDEGRVIIYQ